MLMSTIVETLLNGGLITSLAFLAADGVLPNVFTAEPPQCGLADLQ